MTQKRPKFIGGQFGHMPTKGNPAGKPLTPNKSFKEAAEAFTGGKAETHFKVNAGLRTKQNQAVRQFIEEQRTALYLKTVSSEISEGEFKARSSALFRVRDRMIRELVDWAEDLDPREGASGTNLSREFLVRCVKVFNALREDMGARIEVEPVPLGPVKPHDVEKPTFNPIPDDIKLDDLPVVKQPLQSGPVHERSVLEHGLQQPDLPTIEVKEEISDTESDVSHIEPVVVESLTSVEETEEDNDVHFSSEFGNLPDSEFTDK